MKYIKFESTTGDHPFFIFNVGIPHKAVARALMGFGEPMTAGVVKESPEGLCCEGHSESLGVKSAPEDTQLLRDYLRFL
jgi:hypothetical protein